jgi:ATP-dependent RNA helicase RhlE
MSTQSASSGFHALGLPSRLLATLDRLGFTTPTPIQEQAIPILLKDTDFIGIAQTGTGKTLAFALPTLVNLRRHEMALVLAPTRELAQQIEETFLKLGSKAVLLVGGAPMGRQIAQLRDKPEIIIATPGRLEDHLKQRTLSLRDVRVAILDEADRMLDMGFAPAIKRIMAQVPRERQTMLFSATMPNEILSLAAQFLHEPERVDVARSGATADNVLQELIFVEQTSKLNMLEDLLYDHRGTTLVFARTRHGAKKLARIVRQLGHTAAELHSDRTLAQRRDALDGFKRGDYRVLVATDIAARGIDVKEIGLVVNYDIPQNAEDYVHRIGRTGRAGASGKAITLATPEQKSEVRDIEKLIQAPLELSSRSMKGIERMDNRRIAPTPMPGTRRRRYV